MPRVAAIIVNLVPYHHARWEAYAVVTEAETHLVELTDRDEFKVLECSKEAHFHRHTLFPKSGTEGRNIALRMMEALDAIRPDVVCVSGWGLPVSMAAMKWAAARSVPIVMLSESNEFDEARSAIKEFIKRRLVGLCSSGLAGGSPQADYLVKLGMPRETVFLGYDVVDNRFFEEKSQEFRAGTRESCAQKSPYFFACARFGKKKNLPALIRAYARYLEMAKTSTVFDLVIAGDGEQRVAIEVMIRECGVHDHVHLVGAKGYTELPTYYAQAVALIHASTTEQWGLVVNEAMASGLPVLVSNRCGCAADLVREGENGWTFDPTNEEQIADLMLRISSSEEARAKMGAKSREIITEWGPDRFASGLTGAVQVALSAAKKKTTILDRMILWGMSLK